MAQDQRNHDVFISYSSKDKKVADAIVADMEQHNIRCWYAPRDIRPGDEWASAINAAIQRASIFVLVFTEESNRSHQVTNEVTLAVNSGKTVIPFRLSSSDMNDTLEYYLSSLHWLDAVEPPLNRNIELLREKVSSILAIDNQIAGGAVSSAGAVGSAGTTAGNVYGSAPAGTGNGSPGKKPDRGLLIGIAVGAIAACIVGFLVFGGRGSKSVQEAAQPTAAETPSNEEPQAADDQQPAAEENEAKAEEQVTEEPAADNKEAEAPAADDKESDAAAEADNEPSAEAEQPAAEPQQEAAAVDDDIIVFDDQAFEYAVRRATGIWNRDITKDDAEDVKTLDLSGNNENKYGRINSIKGISAFKWLEKVDLSNNRVTDISELAGLVHLRDAGLEKNRIRDITPLENLTSLTRLDLNINEISDISALKNLTQLRVLDIRSNEISDIQAIKNLQKLQELYIAKNQIEDIAAVSGLRSLRYLSMGYNNIEDISPLYNLTQLGAVTMNGNRIRDISVLTRLKNLYYLEIADNPIDDYSPLNSLPDGVEVVRD